MLLTLAGGGVRFWVDWEKSVLGAVRGTGSHLRIFGNLWSDWLSKGLRGPLGDIAIGIPATYCGLVMLVAIFLGPDLHSTRTISATLLRAARASIGASGWLLIVGAFAGTGYILFEFYPLHLALGVADRGSAMFAGAVGSILLMLSIVGRCVVGARDDSAPYQGPPRCEGCGYELEHIPDSGLCPECRCEVDRSLRPGLWRCGVAWERGKRGTPGALLASAISLILAPREFYSCLCVRGDDRRARRFSAWQFRLIWIGAFVWLISLRTVLGDGPRRQDCVALALIPVLAGWGVWRIMAAISMWWWYAAGELSDPRWSRKVVQYEAAFLWTFCVVLGSGFTFGLWLVQRAVTRRLTLGWFFGIPLPMFFFLVSVGTLVLIGLYRYRIALRAIRWANF